MIQPSTLSETDFTHLQAAARALEVDPPSHIGECAKHILTLYSHYHQNPERARAFIKLSAEHPDWTVLDFIKGTPATHLDLTKLTKLFDLAIRVAQATGSSEHIDWLYSMVEQIQFLEEKPGWLATVAGIATTGIVLPVNPWVAPLTGLAMCLSVRRMTSIETLFQDRTRQIIPEYIPLTDSVRMFYEPQSSGLWGRFMQRSSQTLGQIEIDLQNEPFTCFFDKKKAYQIHASEIKRLHQLMQNMVENDQVEPAVCLENIEALNPFLHNSLRSCLALLATRCKEVASRPSIPLKGNVIDVPGYKNSCGLFALSLAAKKSKKGQIPEDIAGWEDAWLMASNKDQEILEPIHTYLRNQIANALRNNLQFKLDSRQSFISCCVSYLAQNHYPVEMEAFFKSNISFLKNLDTLIGNQLSTDEKKQYIELLNSPSTAITAEDIRKMKEAMKKSGDFTTLFGSLFSSTANPLHRIIQQQRLFWITWGCLPTLHLRRKIRQDQETWLQSKITPETAKTLALLSSTDFSLDNSAFTLSHDDAINAEIVRFGIIALVHAAWDDLYNNYTAYIQKNSCMLTADELQVLANSWNLKLGVIEWSKRAPRALTPTVYLTNPSRSHWLVFEPSP